MINLRKSEERGMGRYGWLEAKYSFSFASYFDDHHLGFGDLIVLNEDVIAAGKGFDVHGHRDMEIITYIIDGAIEHKDSMGYHGIVKPGEIQYISAGSGITHSEFNPLKNQETRLIQIWIRPDRKGHEPRYGQDSYRERSEPNSLCLIVSGDGRKGSVKINQDIDLFTGKFDKGLTTSYNFMADRRGWLQIVSGAVNINGIELKNGDGMSVSDQSEIGIRFLQNTEFLLFDTKER
ncbi:pirin family protein [Bacteriovoracaceae bacterium]|nr:pirin family protein [Bacteriovoracaceae bacterium]